MSPEELLPAPKDGHCPTCKGPAEFTLCEDKSHYSQVLWRDGDFVVVPSAIESMDDEMSVRFFCSNCGTYFHVPEGVAP